MTAAMPPHAEWLDLAQTGTAVLVCSAAVLTRLYNLYAHLRAYRGRIKPDPADVGDEEGRTRRTQQAEVVLEDVQKNRLTDEVPLAYGRFRLQVSHHTGVAHV